MKFKTTGILLGLAFLCLSLSACSDPVGRTVPVKGKVMVDGKPLTTGSVTFWPIESKGNKLAFQPGSPIGEDGSYELFTHGKNGAPPGEYKVTIISQPKVDSTAPLKAKSLVPEAFTNKDTTKLEVKVEDASKTYDLDVK